MNLLPTLALAAVASFSLLPAMAVQPEVAEFSFDARFNKGSIPDKTQLPKWMTGVEQQGGRYLDDPKCWHVPPSMADGVGRLSFSIDRKAMPWNVVGTFLFDASEDADIAVQLMDAQGRTVVTDLFGNLVDVGRETTTDTYVIPLKKYPTAEKIVLRRIHGEIKVYGAAFFPVVTEGTPVNAELEKLARVLGDPLSPENPLSKSLSQIAKNSQVALDPAAPKPEQKQAAEAAVRKVYSAAVPAKAGATTAPAPLDGLVAYWNFDAFDGADSSGHKHDARLKGAVQMAPGLHGKAMQLRRARAEAAVVGRSAEFDLKDTCTLSAWINYRSISPNWGSQIVWYGDERLGRDPLVLNLFTDGTLQFRSDRSITGKPIFRVWDNELELTSEGKPNPSQHVATWSPGTLAPNTWYFVTATMEKSGPRTRTMRLWINGEAVSETRTDEVVNYRTDTCWITIGGADTGTWQCFDGLIDEVRIYDRALSAAEIQALYQQAPK